MEDSVVKVIKIEALAEMEKLERDLRKEKIKFHKLVADILTIEEKIDKIRENKENWEPEND